MKPRQNLQVNRAKLVSSEWSINQLTTHQLTKGGGPDYSLKVP